MVPPIVVERLNPFFAAFAAQFLLLKVQRRPKAEASPNESSAATWLL